MKKLILTLTILLGLSMTSFADGGLFNRGNNAKNGASGYIYFNGKDVVSEDPVTPLLPGHGKDTNQPAPLSSGIVVLVGLGAAYLVGKRRKQE